MEVIKCVSSKKRLVFNLSNRMKKFEDGSIFSCRIFTMVKESWKNIQSEH